MQKNEINIQIWRIVPGTGWVAKCAYVLLGVQSLRMSKTHKVSQKIWGQSREMFVCVVSLQCCCSLPKQVMR